MLKFEWNEDKATINLRKHDVSFDEAGTVFLDPLAVSQTYRPGAIRIISARSVTRAERKVYEEG